MNIKPLFALVLGVLALAACKQQPAPVAGMPEETKTEKEYYNYRFKGTLPCADCPGIVTELSFYDDSLNYIEKDTYLERPNTLERRGSYTLVKGYKGNDNQLMFVLDEQDGHGRKFLQLNDSTLLMLDGQGEVIGMEERYQLHQVKEAN